MVRKVKIHLKTSYSLSSGRKLHSSYRIHPRLPHWIVIILSNEAADRQLWFTENLLYNQKRLWEKKKLPLR